MKSAADRLAEDLAHVAFRDPSPPVVANVTAEPNAAAARIPELLARQVAAPVRFHEMVTRLAALGVTRVLEIGPGRVLAGLVARIEPSLERATLGRAGELDSAVAFATETAAEPGTAG